MDLMDPMDPTRLLCPWDSLGKNTGSGLPFSFPGDLPDPGIRPKCLASPALAGELSLPVSQGLHFRALKSSDSHSFLLCPGLWQQKQKPVVA